MKAAVVICECNPFHYGHKHVLERAKRNSDCVIAVMSGNFVQRAEPAVFEKYVRAEAVLAGGADLVVELPFPWSSASAEYFAFAGVALAESLSASRLCFGASDADAEYYLKIAEISASEAFALKLEELAKRHSAAGIAVLREKALAELAGEEYAAAMRIPNDILAVEYCRAIKALNSEICVCPVSRISDKDELRFLGASGIREKMRNGDAAGAFYHMPDCAAHFFKREWDLQNDASAEKMDEILFAILRLADRSLFYGNETADGTDGVLERLVQCAAESRSPQEMYISAATKKYTNRRFRRAALFYLMQVKKEMLKTKPRFTQLLAANSTGCRYLSEIRKTAGIRIITKPADGKLLTGEAAEQFRQQEAADRLYTMCMKNVEKSSYFMRKGPCIQK